MVAVSGARIPFRTKSAFLAFPLLLFCCRLFNYSAVRADFVFFLVKKMSVQNR